MIEDQFHTECRSIDSRRTHRSERVGWVYGWSGNKYRNHVGVTLTGAKDGWCAASGNLVEGEGRYMG
jgi:hypothetical protein